jgi:hypothetical protein
MKANEIQIGDLLYYKGQFNAFPFKVESITKKKVGYHAEPNEHRMHYLRLSECKPIPLVPEILEKNGFKVREYSDDTEYFYYDGYRINIDFNEGLPADDIPPTIFLSIDFAEKDIAMPIEYVHELQQSMRIMGCDKEIEL